MKSDFSSKGKLIDAAHFVELVGEEVVESISKNARKKVLTRVAKSLHHFSCAKKLVDIDEEMGAIRLIAGEEELVVAIFEMLKLNESAFPEHKYFVRRYKNHVVKLAFYPVLSQFRFILQDMLNKNFSLQGFEGVLDWTARPIFVNNLVRLAIYNNEGEEVFRHNPLAIEITRNDVPGDKIVDAMMDEFRRLVEVQQKQSLRQFLIGRADYRNKLLYAGDAGSFEMGDRLVDLIEIFERAYHDLLWTLAIIIGAEPMNKHWGLASQFIALYRRALIEAGSLNASN